MVRSRTLRGKTIPARVAVRLESSAAPAEGSALEVLIPLGDRGQCTEGLLEGFSAPLCHLQYQGPEPSWSQGLKPGFRGACLQARKVPSFPASPLFLSGLFHSSDRIVTNG